MSDKTPEDRIYETPALVKLRKKKNKIQGFQQHPRAAGLQGMSLPSTWQDINKTQDAPLEVVNYPHHSIPPANTPKTRNMSQPTDRNGPEILELGRNKTVYICNCLGHSSNGAFTYNGMYSTSNEGVIIKKWCLPVVPVTTESQTRSRQIATLYKELKAIRKINHPSLVPYIALNINKVLMHESMGLNVHIFRYYIPGCSLKVFETLKFNLFDSIDAVKFFREVAFGVLSALKQLHSISVVHRDVRSENVFFDGAVVKLVGAGLDSRLAEMFHGKSICYRQTKAQDILAVAELLLSLVAHDEPGQIPDRLPGSAKDFLARCQAAEGLQWSAEKLLEHEFLVKPLAELFQPAKISEVTGVKKDEEKIPPPMANIPSRLDDEFEFLGRLGSGAFGYVIKAKHKIDGRQYAIKLIPVDGAHQILNEKWKNEAKLLSEIDNKYCVRYHHCWTQKVDQTSNFGYAGSSDSIMFTEGPVPNTGSDKDEENYYEDSEPQMISKRDVAVEFIVEFDAGSHKKSMTISSNGSNSESQGVMLKTYLCIQMEYCEKTLWQVIVNGLYKEPARSWKYFIEIVNGLKYLHKKGIIHRDLKPVNIFLDKYDTIKIGDFGQAARIDRPTEMLNWQEALVFSLTAEVGTALYVAPELLQTANKANYNQKVDMYSLGIILFEMLHPPFSTAMERMEILTKLRMKEIIMPEDFKRKNHTIIGIIRLLLDHDQTRRPTCEKILVEEHIYRNDVRLLNRFRHSFIGPTVAMMRQRSNSDIPSGKRKEELNALSDFDVLTLEIDEENGNE